MLNTSRFIMISFYVLHIQFRKFFHPLIQEIFPHFQKLLFLLSSRLLRLATLLGLPLHCAVKHIDCAVIHTIHRAARWNFVHVSKGVGSLYVSLSNTGRSYEIILRQDVLIAVQTLEAESEQYWLSCIIIPFRIHFKYSSVYDLEHAGDPNSPLCSCLCCPVPLGRTIQHILDL